MSISVAKLLKNNTPKTIYSIICYEIMGFLTFINLILLVYLLIKLISICRGTVIYTVPENHTVAVTLFKDSRTNELEDKDWTFVLEDVSIPYLI